MPSCGFGTTFTRVASAAVPIGDERRPLGVDVELDRAPRADADQEVRKRRRRLSVRCDVEQIPLRVDPEGTPPDGGAAPESQAPGGDVVDVRGGTAAVDEQRQVLPGELEVPAGARPVPGDDVDASVRVGDDRAHAVEERLVGDAVHEEASGAGVCLEPAVERREQPPPLPRRNLSEPARRGSRRLQRPRIEGERRPCVVDPRDVGDGAACVQRRDPYRARASEREGGRMPHLRLGAAPDPWRHVGPSRRGRAATRAAAARSKTWPARACTDGTLLPPYERPMRRGAGITCALHSQKSGARPVPVDSSSQCGCRGRLAPLVVLGSWCGSKAADSARLWAVRAHVPGLCCGQHLLARCCSSYGRAHTAGRSAWARFTQATRGCPAELVSDDGHKANILNPAWSSIGVGVCRASNGGHLSSQPRPHDRGRPCRCRTRPGSTALAPPVEPRATRGSPTPVRSRSCARSTMASSRSRTTGRLCRMASTPTYSKRAVAERGSTARASSRSPPLGCSRVGTGGLQSG